MMRQLSRTIGWAVISVLALTSASAQAVRKPNAKERKAVLDGLRVRVQKELGQKVVFRVDDIRIYKTWSFMRGQPLSPSGKVIDYKKTIYKEALKEGLFDDWVCAVLKRKNNKWIIVRYVLGATDVAYDGWDQELGLPRALFGLPPRVEEAAIYRSLSVRKRVQKFGSSLPNLQRANPRTLNSRAIANFWTWASPSAKNHV